MTLLGLSTLIQTPLDRGLVYLIWGRYGHGEIINSRKVGSIFHSLFLELLSLSLSKTTTPRTSITLNFQY